MLKICPTCNTEFKARGTQPIYCSRKCYHRKGASNPKWKGGILRSGGYCYVYMPDHPYATKMGYVLEHRLVMENFLERRLGKHEIIHHINHDPSDNRIENLMIYDSPGKHFINEHFSQRTNHGRFTGESTEITNKARHLTDADWLREQYIDKMRTAQDIASEIGCTRNAITHAINKHGFSRRKTS